MDTYDITHRVTWARRTAGMLGAGTLGAVYGAAVGAVAAFLPAIFGQLGVEGASAATGFPAISAIASSASLFAGVVSVIGMTLGADVGANAASASTALTAQEARKTGRVVSEVQKDQEILEGKKPQLYTWKAAAILVPLFAAFGALIALNPVTASATAALGFQGATATAGASHAAIAATSAVFGMFGGFMAFSNSAFTNTLSNFYMKVFNGTAFDKAPEQPMPLAAAVQQEKVNEVPEAQITGLVREEAPRVSFQAMLAERAERADVAQTI